jgi:hypothetical protein
MGAKKVAKEEKGASEGVSEVLFVITLDNRATSFTLGY